jgi:glycosyltransferase involved in cell wall biosynthesis
VVATAVGGIPEIIRDGENGMLVRPDEPAAFEAAVATLHADGRLRARVASANRLRAREFSAATMTGRYERLYRELAARDGIGLTPPSADATRNTA